MESGEIRYSKNDLRNANYNAIFLFRADGTGAVISTGGINKTTYSVSGHTIVMDGRDTNRFSLKNGTLTVYNDDADVRLTLKKILGPAESNDASALLGTWEVWEMIRPTAHNTHEELVSRKLSLRYEFSDDGIMYYYLYRNGELTSREAWFYVIDGTKLITVGSDSTMTYSLENGGLTLKTQDTTIRFVKMD